jgi:DNA-binding transcriptional LysR family regulator
MADLVRAPESEELRAFCAAVELGSLGRAARLLGISQPAVTKRIQGLENLVGIALLDRSAQGVTATAAGEKLHAQAREFLAHSKALGEVMGQLRGGQRGTVLLAASHTVAEAVLPGMIADFEQEEESVSIELLSANSTVVRNQVAEGRVELGIAGRCPIIAHPDRLDEQPFCSDEIVLAVPHGHRWRAMSEVPLEEFLGEPMVMRDSTSGARRVVEGVLRAHDHELPRPLVEVGSTAAAQRAALSRRAPILISALSLPEPTDGGEPLFAIRAIAGLRFPREFVLLCADPATLAAPARALHQHLATTDRS